MYTRRDFLHASTAIPMATLSGCMNFFGMGTRPWRAAQSLLALRTQLNERYPTRSIAHDGLIGDTAHCPGSSDHCPNIDDGDTGVGVVTAFDATHDPNSGCDMDVVVSAIVESRDERIKYIIWNKRIISSKREGSTPAWQWRDYEGRSPHDKHAHFSVKAERQKFDDASVWAIGDQTSPRTPSLG